MYNLFVSGHPDSWNGDVWQIERGRCVREYTDDKISEQFAELNDQSVSQLRRLPCIFAYESGHRLQPKFGVLRDIVSRQGQVRIEYNLQPITPFLTADQLSELSFELDIHKWEMNRTHWAVKDINLAKELNKVGISLPHWARGLAAAVDIDTHHFDVGLSFPGEARGYVEQVAESLEGHLGPHSYFYDNNYVAQLARPGLDTLLQGIYRDRSQLIVIFIGSDYQRKEWCGVEWRAIRDVILGREHRRIMFVRIDDGNVDGVFRGDGFVDARRFSPEDIAGHITERVNLLRET